MEKTLKTTGRDGIDASIYDEVFSAELDPTTLEDLFVQFNSGCHPLHRGWSMSVSDVVVIEPEGIPPLVGEIKGTLPAGGRFSQRFTDLVEYNLKIDELRERNIDFEAHDMVEYLKGIGLGCLGILILTALLFGARFILGKEQRVQEHTLPQSGSRSSPRQERRRGRHEKT